MKLCGIVCEYNPFHNGHLYQIQKIKELGYDAVVCIMSGNFVQRGDVALYDKKLRAAAAVKCGADLVLELPAVYSLCSAEGFAFNSIYILNSLGIVDGLAFGTESSDLSILSTIAKLLCNEDGKYVNLLKSNLHSGLPYFLARRNAISELLGSEAADAISQPNNILAVEYLKALAKTGSAMQPHLIQRISTNHNLSSLTGKFSSGAAIRRAAANGDFAAIEAVPLNVRAEYLGAAKHSIEKLTPAIITKILTASADEIANTPDVSEGLENKIKKAALTAKTFIDLCDTVKSKRYAHSRIRRILVRFLLGITADDLACPSYIKILEFNRIGQELLHEAKRTALLPLAKNRNAVKGLSRAQQAWDRELIFDKIFELSSL